MDTRQVIERVLEATYAARQRQDLDEVAGLFADAGRFNLNGLGPAASGKSERRSALKGLFDSLELTDFHLLGRVIDPPRAVVHWRGKFRSKKSGEVAESEILDLFEIENERISSLKSFFDTALAARLMG